MPITEMPEFNTGHSSPVLNIQLWDCITWQMITSGHRITMTTDDVVLHPLPNWDVVKLQWHLHRIAVMFGAGPKDDEDLNNDEDHAGVADVHSDQDSDSNDDW